MEDELEKLTEQTENIYSNNKSNEAKARGNAERLFSKMGMGSGLDSGTFRVTHKLNLLADEGAYMLIVDS